ncbi:MAG: TonB-dependent receptor [Acidobacteriia bacterium]|nr:TonB-dependent receptor [Terriglobia bacterium]
MFRSKRVLVAALLAVALAWTLGGDLAVAGSTQTGTVRGKVVDQKGEALPGVTIVCRSPSLIRDRVLLTDKDGNFFAPGLAPGHYGVIAELTGYTKIESGTDVLIDKTTVVNLALRAGEITETVSVSAQRPVVDTMSTETETQVTTDYAEYLPVARQYQSLLTFAPGVLDVSGSGNPNMMGGSASANVYLVDGVSIGDPVTGTFGANINYDAIEAVDVKLTGVSAEYGSFQGGLSNLITKSGGNNFTGSLRNVITNPAWTYQFGSSATSLLAAPHPQPEGCNSDDLNCFDVPVQPNNRGADGKANDVETTLGGPIVRDAAWFFVSYNRSENASNQILGDPLGGPFANGTYTRVFEADFSNAKLTWQATNNHKLQYTFSSDPASVPVCYGNQFFGGSCWETYDVDFQHQGGHVYVGSWNAVWSPKIFTDVKYARYQNSFQISPFTPVPARPDFPHATTGDVPAPVIDLNTGNLFDNSIFAPVPEDRNREQYEAAATMAFNSKSAGSHTVKVGLDYEKQDAVGSSVIAGNALFYLQGFVTAPPAGDAFDVNNRRYFAWTDFAPPGPGGSTTKLTTLYAQDDWALSPHWSFNLGLRYEKSQNENDVGEKIIDSSGIAPRIGATFDVTGQGKDVIKATAARYLAGINLATLSPFVRAAGGQSSYDTYLNATFPTPGTPTWVLQSSVRPSAAGSQFAPGIKPQAIDEYTLGYEHAFTPSFGVGVKAIDRTWKDVITFSYTYTYDADGVPTKVQRLDNNGAAKRDFKALVLSAEKRFAGNWQLQGNYTYSKAEGNVQNDQGFDTFGSYAGVPETTVNRFGYLPWDSRQALKLFANYQVPFHSKRHALSVGAVGSYIGGIPYQRQDSQLNVVVGPGADGTQDAPLGTVVPGNDTLDQTALVLNYYEPAGSHHAKAFEALDLSLVYRFAFNKQVTWQTRLEMFNVTNAAAPITVNQQWYPNPQNGTEAGADYVFGHPSSYGNIQGPRRYDVQFAILW